MPNGPRVKDLRVVRPIFNKNLYNSILPICNLKAEPPNPFLCTINFRLSPSALFISSKICLSLETIAILRPLLSRHPSVAMYPTIYHKFLGSILSNIESIALDFSTKHSQNKGTLRRRWDLHPRIAVLQTAALATSPRRQLNF